MGLDLGVMLLRTDLQSCETVQAVTGLVNSSLKCVATSPPTGTIMFRYYHATDEDARAVSLSYLARNDFHAGKSSWVELRPDLIPLPLWAMRRNLRMGKYQ